MGDKICPLRNKRFVPAYVAKGVKTMVKAEIYCIKEKCAWWCEENATSGDMAPKHIFKEENCAIKRLAEK